MPQSTVPERLLCPCYKMQFSQVWGWVHLVDFLDVLCFLPLGGVKVLEICGKGVTGWFEGSQGHKRVHRSPPLNPCPYFPYKPTK